MSQIHIKKFIIVIAFLFAANAVRVHSDRSTQEYYPKLDAVQTQLTTDLQILKQQMSDLNKNLENALTDQKKKALLSQGLADQRDTIFRIDSYLSIPYENRECQCQSITSKQKKELIQQANAVKNSIDEIQKTIDQCKNCNLIDELKKQLKLQRNYLRIINGTVTGACCDEAYSICEQGFVFNQLTKKCQIEEINPSSGNGTFIVPDANGTTNIIDQLTPRCPKTAPLWNSKTQLCEICPQQTPYWNKIVSKCQKCQDNTVYKQELKTCWKKCPESGQKFNYDQRKCQIFLSGASICPNESPIWDPELLYCRKCPKDTPLWNIATQQCQKCPKNTYWHDNLSFCVENCKKGFILNEQTRKCEGQCFDITKPAWDGQTETCVACPSTEPAWNSQNRKCSSCPSEKPIWNAQSQQCQEDPHLNEANGTVIKRDSNTSSCLIGMSFDQSQLRCRCPDNLEYSQDKKNCVACPDGSSFQYHSQRCVENPIDAGAVNGTAINKKNDNQKVQCKQGQHFSAGLSKCIQICKADQLYSIDTGDCRKMCQEGQVYNIVSKKCQQKSFYCPKGAYYDQRIHKCLKCPTGYVYIPDSKKCRFLCKQGQKYSEETRKCL